MTSSNQVDQTGQQGNKAQRKVFSVEKAMMRGDTLVAPVSSEIPVQQESNTMVYQQEIERLSGEVTDLKNVIFDMKQEIMQLMQSQQEDMLSKITSHLDSLPLQRIDISSESESASVAEVSVDQTNEGDVSVIEEDSVEGKAEDPSLSHDSNTFVIDAEHEKDLRIELGQMIRVIAKAKRELSQIKHPGHGEDEDQITRASSELDEIVSATEAATNQILEATEGIEEHLLNLASIAMNLQNDEIVICGDRINQRVTTIIEACNFQDITGQRIAKVVRTMTFIEERVRAMIDIWGADAFSELPLPKIVDEDDPEAHLLEGPQLSNQGITQDEIDDLFK